MKIAHWALLISALFAVVAALPPFQFGYWIHNSGPVLAMRVAGAGLCVLLAVQALRASGDVAIALPAALAFALAAWTLFAGFVAGGLGGALLSLNGAPQLGDGAAFWLVVAALTVAYGGVCQTSRGRTVCIGAATLAALTECALHIAARADLGAPAPYTFPDGLGWAGICLAAIAAYRARDDSVGGAEKRMRIGAIIVAIGAVATSENVSAQIAILFAPLLLLRGRMPTPIAFFVIFTPAFVFVLFAVSPEALPVNNVSIQHRLEFWLAVSSEFFNDIVYFLFGIGWGSLEDISLSNFLISERHRVYVDGVFDASTADGDAFMTMHSHSLFVEAAAAGGVIGMLAMCALICGAAFRPGGTPWAHFAVVAMFGAVASAWYVLPAHTAFLALALAMISGGAMRFRIGRRAFAALCIGVAAVLAGVGGNEAAQSRRLAVWTQAPEAEMATLRRLAEADAHGAYATIALQQALGYLLSAAQRGDDLAAVWPPTLAVWRAVRAKAAVLDRAAYFDLVARTHVLVGDDSAAFAPPPAAAAWIREDWMAAALAATARAPTRRDLSAPPLADAFARRDGAALRAGADALLIRDADDPVGLFFSGLAHLLHDTAPESAFRLMNHALDQGVERYYPVSEDLRTAIRSQN